MPELIDSSKCSGAVKYNPSDRELALDEKAMVQADPLRLVEFGFLCIKTKDGRLIHFKLNSVQKRILKKIRDLRAAGRPIRIWILKARQMGFSTFIEAVIYAMTSQQENRNSLIMADLDDHVGNIFEMSKLYHEQLEITSRHLAPVLKRSNAQELVFESIHSHVSIDSARNLQAARSGTYQYAHLSEVAFFPHFGPVIGGLNQTVPLHPDTMIFGESTANGMNDFYDEWIRAVQGKTDWIPMFFPWFEMEEYRMPLLKGELVSIEGIKFNADTTQEQFLVEEKDLQHKYNLDDDQINWRRWCIINNCQGNIMTFRQEYPATWEEAFSLSGSVFFDRIGLKEQRSRKRQALAIGEIYYQDMNYVWRDQEYGRIEIFEHPDPDEEYIVTGDASKAVGADEAAALVLNKRTNETAAIVANSAITPEELADIIINLGHYYNEALVVPENESYGYMVCQNVYKKYGNIYKHHVDRTGDAISTDELGFNTNSVTRPAMLAQLNEEIRNGSTQLVSKKLIDECQTFIIKRNAQGQVTKVEAQNGFQDGLVICRAIAGYIRRLFPYTGIAPKRERSYNQAKLKEQLSRPMVRYR